MFHHWLGKLFILVVLANQLISINSKLVAIHSDDLSEEARDYTYVKCVQECPCYEYIHDPPQIDCHGNADSTSEDGRKMTGTGLRLVRKDFLPTTLNYSYNQIGHLHRNLMLNEHMRSQVEILDLSHNQIWNIESEAFDGFPKLRILKLGHNRLGRDNGSMKGWLTPKLGETLEELYLDYNGLGTFEMGPIKQMKRLRKLVLDGNRGLEFVETSIDDKPDGVYTMEELSLNYCEMTWSSDFLFHMNLKDLRKLSLIGNPIRLLPVSFLIGLPKLKILDISETNIEQMHNRMSRDLPIEELYARRMPKLHEIDYLGMPNLKILDVQNSPKLSVILPRTFGYDGQSKARLEHFNIEHCNVTSLPEILLPWRQVRDIRIGNNPLACDVRMAWLINDRNIVVNRFGVTATCASPPELRGVPLRQIRMIENHEKPTESIQTSRGIDQTVGTRQTPGPIKYPASTQQWYPWYKRRTTPEPRHQPRSGGTTRSHWPPRSYTIHRRQSWRYYYETNIPPYRYDSVLNDRIMETIHQIFQQAKQLAKGPVLPFVGGFLAAILIIIVIYYAVHLLRFLCRSIWNLLATKLWPFICGVSRIVMPLLLNLLRMLAYALLGICRACLEMLRQRTSNLRHRNLDRTHLLSGVEKQAVSEPVSTITNPNTVFVYDRQSDNASIVQ